MNEKHIPVKLRVILAALNMAEEDAHVFVESNRDFDKEGERSATKQYNRVVRAKQYFYELFVEPPAEGGCSGGCGGCKGGCCGEEEE